MTTRLPHGFPPREGAVPREWRPGPAPAGHAAAASEAELVIPDLAKESFSG